jgi:putative ABC transport system permease protein
LPKGEKTFLNTLVKQYPSITIIELDAIMNQVKTILTQVTLAVEYVMAFVLLAGITVLLAALQSSMDERMHNATIIRTLGAKKHYIRKTLLAEFSLLGLFAGLIAVLGTELTAWVLYTRVFDLPFELHGWMWLAGPAAGVLFITLAGYASTRKVMNQSPMKTLREI